MVCSVVYVREDTEINNMIVFEDEEDVQVVPTHSPFSSCLLYLVFGIGWPSWPDRAGPSILSTLSKSRVEASSEGVAETICFLLFSLEPETWGGKS